MKLTDFALIFVAIFLPIVIIVYVNTSFVVKAEKQEMYYKNLMNSAVTDAVSEMKQVENQDDKIDYGYSGIVDNKISINQNLAISTFYNSLANNFNIKGNDISLDRLKMYIPVVAVLDYDGIYIHSAEIDANKNVVFTTKPKVYYTYYYVIKKNSSTSCEMIELADCDNFNSLLSNYIYEVNFTMDDYIFLNIYKIQDNKLGKVQESKAFYISDNNNNRDLVYIDANNLITSDTNDKLRTDIINNLNNIRKRIIAEISMKEIAYAVNKHNSYARQAGITYNFTFSVESDSQWYETIDGIGMIAIIQGISLGNRYLNYKAYSASDLVVAKKYYVSNGIVSKDNEGKEIKYSYMSRKLYHNSKDCPVYKEYLNSTKETLIPGFYLKKADAATQGFYPCPVCHP